MLAALWLYLRWRRFPQCPEDPNTAPQTALTLTLANTASPQKTGPRDPPGASA